MTPAPVNYDAYVYLGDRCVWLAELALSPTPSLESAMVTATPFFLLPMIFEVVVT